MPSKYNLLAAAGLGTLLLHECVSCWMTHRSAKKAMGLIKGIKGWLLPSQLLCVTFIVLFIQHMIFINIAQTWFAHATPAGVRGNSKDLPVYTINFIEWLINVPILLVAAGKCALDQPMEALTRPIVVTNTYIIFSWVAFFLTDPTLKWGLVVLSFLMYGWASYDMYQWVIDFRIAESADAPSRALKQWLAVGLIIIFGIYGVVYLLSLLNLISPFEERVAYMFMGLSSKLGMSMAFAGIRSSETVDLLITMLIQTNIPFRRQHNAALEKVSELRYASLMAKAQEDDEDDGFKKEN